MVGQAPPAAIDNGVGGGAFTVNVQGCVWVCPALSLKVRTNAKLPTVVAPPVRFTFGPVEDDRARSCTPARLQLYGGTPPEALKDAETLPP